MENRLSEIILRDQFPGEILRARRGSIDRLIRRVECARIESRRRELRTEEEINIPPLFPLSLSVRHREIFTGKPTFIPSVLLDVLTGVFSLAQVLIDIFLETRNFP